VPKLQAYNRSYHAANHSAPRPYLERAQAPTSPSRFPNRGPRNPSTATSCSCSPPTESRAPQPDYDGPSTQLVFGLDVENWIPDKPLSSTLKLRISHRTLAQSEAGRLTSSQVLLDRPMRLPSRDRTNRQAGPWTTAKDADWETRAAILLRGATPASPSRSRRWNYVALDRSRRSIRRANQDSKRAPSQFWGPSPWSMALDGCSGREMEGLIAIEQDLDEVVARLHLRERSNGYIRRLESDDSGLSGDPVFDVESEHS